MTMVVGYGTLLSRHSLQSTIGGNEADVMRCLSVTVPGWRRLYNLRAAHYTPSCVLGTPGVEASAANVEPAPGCAFNGLMFEVNAAQLASLDARERCYRRIEVEMFDFSTERSLGVGFTYTGAADRASLVRDSSCLLPHWRDIALARTGAYQVDNTFGAFWDATSFLADGVTPVLERYRDHLAQMAVDASTLT